MLLIPLFLGFLLLLYLELTLPLKLQSLLILGVVLVLERKLIASVLIVEFILELL